jgi:hypothetical protein
MKPSSPSTDVKTDANAKIDFKLRNLEEPHRSALGCVVSTLDSAQVLAKAAFGAEATPDHALTLLDHLLAQADRVEVNGPDYDEESE